ncbi:hypothetical protein TheetDRAFT_2014 [Thermoanaerobacter ethanolicus JW 200]|jgi:hypothetical protein|uniref:Uncharacterized protein n=1 Tax=Thermoanaerobacter thermohydrosulfuricus WC1 TaxID=1198630 RepID=M8DRW1_THETY|nr:MULTISPECIES: hypothetical protein [Thermoanaerobacter]EGD51183.1 hypothetical protein TheetDRAFT_2014 [Thermoanaerobacter ethanolicus JW 200]MDI3528900.1 hypothetical protein [Thermoanaerobacter sp.]ABY93191.1 hypothetical protein Teth514_1912 [Thermoanaerobacter sp. X514]EMT39251.1 hypothetical protein TthWC1_1192 [Thermoanaerobacter thermohydrosulfuricus WC1]UZQ82179.1 hypothetical protein OEI98_001990 [Thermoanaerobacter sp. RKWS2]
MWTWQHVVTTIFGGILFPLAIGLMWGKLAEEWKSIGGLLAGFFIVGTVWLVNHGIGLIFEPQMSGHLPGPWSDQALTAFWGAFVADLFDRKKINWAAILAGILGGLLGGLLLYATV